MIDGWLISEFFLNFFLTSEHEKIKNAIFYMAFLIYLYFRIMKKSC